MPNKYLDSEGLAEYTGLVKDYVDTKADDYLPLTGGTLTGNVYITPYYDSTIVDPEGGQTLIVSKGKVAKGTAPSNDEWHTMVMAVDNSGLTNNANKYGQVETAVKTDGSVETTVQAYKNEANSTTSAKISVGYDANGNAFTSAPTPTAGDNSTKIATTAFVQNEIDAEVTRADGAYLPLSGGTMTGDISFNRSSAAIKNTTSTYDGLTTIYGGGGGSTGGYLRTYAYHHATLPGVFEFRANDGNQGSTLQGKPDGTLTWGNKNIERIESSGTNYIRYVSGLQICWGTLNVLGAAVNDETITFPMPFKDGSSYNITAGRYWAYSKDENYHIKSTSGTGFTWSTVGTVSTNSHGYRYIAIGFWK